MFSSNSSQVSSAANYIEDVFSTYLYAGTNANITITNNIDLSTYGGLVWQKQRTSAIPHRLFTTAMALGAELASNSTGALTNAGNLTAYSSTGFTLFNALSDIGENYVTWTFRKQAKFFDVVTWTGNATNRTIAHSLGSVPGCIIVKRTDAAAAWAVYHRSLANTQYLVLNDTAAAATGATWWNSTTPTSAVFSLGTDASVNASGGTYVAYLFAHDAGGFGLAGTDNVISCGSYTGVGGGNVATITLGYEPQWILVKRIDNSAGGNWAIFDNMRGMSVNLANNASMLNPNVSDAESVLYAFKPTATGFQTGDNFTASGGTYIYIAIRRGPMKVPTLGTSVFGLNARTGTGANATVTGGQTDDAVLIKNRGSAVASLFSSRLTDTGYLVTSATAAEVAAGTTILQANPWDVMDGVKVGTTSTITNASANTYINYLFRRAPGFFDEVCYKGNGTNGRTITHNLSVTPELIIVKNRTTAGTDWPIRCSVALTTYKEAFLNLTDGTNFWSYIQDQSSTTFTVGNDQLVNYSAGDNYVAYLFATCAGVSKVGSYTGTATTLQIDCGFTGGARFVLIKRTDSIGDWYVWDSARGIVAGNDSYLLLNSTAAEVTSTDYIDTYSAGFEISSTAPAAINASAGTFVFLAIA